MRYCKPLSTQIDREVLRELRDCVVQLSGPPERLTIKALVERAIIVELGRLRRSHNGGKPFKPYHHRPRAGRPVRQ